jgi:hypothetical protein
LKSKEKKERNVITEMKQQNLSGQKSNDRKEKAEMKTTVKEELK